MEGMRGHRPLNRDPDPPKGAPKMPPGMPDRAKTLWRRLTTELDALNLITVVDGAALEGICRAYDQAVEADQIIKRCQREIRKELNTKGPVTASGWYQRLGVQNAISKKAWSQFKVLSIEFGLTPASRTRLSVGETGRVIDDLEAEMA